MVLCRIFQSATTIYAPNITTLLAERMQKPARQVVIYALIIGTIFSASTRLSLLNLKRSEDLVDFIFSIGEKILVIWRQ